VFPAKQKTHIGGTVSFRCYSKSHVQWEFDSSTFLPRNAKLSALKIYSEYLLEIVNVTVDNAGTYTCRGSNGNHNFRSAGILIVRSTLCQCLQLILCIY